MKIRPLMVSVGFAALALGLAGTTAWAANSCVLEAKAEYQDCKAGCLDAFTTAKDSCFNKLVLCVEACQTQRQDCIDATGLPALLQACNAQTQQAVQQCKTAPDPETCEDQAQLVGFQCRQAARRNTPGVKACRQTFHGCIAACPPNPGPTVNPATCRTNAKDAYVSCLGDCKNTFNVERGVCHGKSPVCVADCGVARENCVTPVEDQLNAAIAACRATLTQQVAACKGIYPPGSSQLAQCIENAQAAAFLCRDAAGEAAQPQLQACQQAFVGCVQGCPSSPSGAFLDAPR
ncbi:MAG TPA: hypothetical protein VKW76_00490 [Candidatus Binatia bacterium]|nr:hypothetical protein [Candidatus Binatia bacterium]